MSYDNVCKLLAEKYPLEFVRWLLPTRAKKVTVLKTELSIETARKFGRSICRFYKHIGFRKVVK